MNLSEVPNYRTLAWEEWHGIIQPSYSYTLLDRFVVLGVLFVFGNVVYELSLFEYKISNVLFSRSKAIHFTPLLNLTISSVLNDVVVILSNISLIIPWPTCLICLFFFFWPYLGTYFYWFKLTKSRSCFSFYISVQWCYLDRSRIVV